METKRRPLSRRIFTDRLLPWSQPWERTDLMEILARRKAKGSTESPVSEEETQIASLRNELRVLRKTLLEQAEAIKKLGETRAGSGLR